MTDVLSNATLELFEAVPVPLLILNKDSSVLTANRFFCEMFSLPKESIKNHLLEDFTFFETVMPVLKPLFSETVSAGIPVGGVEIELDLPESGHKTFRLQSRPIVEMEQKTAILLIFEDITPFKRAEEIRASLSAIIEFSDDAIVTKTLEGIITSWNEGAKRIFGYSAEEVLGKSILILFPPELVHEEVQFLQRLGRGEHIDHYETIRVRKDGQRIDISVTISPIWNAAGKIIGISKIARDISQHKAAEEHLHHLQTMTTALSEALTQQQVADIVLEQIVTLLGAHLGALLLVNAEGTVLETLKTYGVPEDIHKLGKVFPLAQSMPITDAVRSEQPIWIESLEDYQMRYPAIAQSVQLITQTQSTACLPLTVNGKTIGGLVISFPQPKLMSGEERAFMVALAQQCAQALDRAQLIEQTREIAASEERQRLARDLHDAVSQTLFTASVLAQSLPRLWERKPERVFEHLNDLSQLIQGASAEMRALLVELRPAMLLSHTLSELLNQLAQTVQARKHIQVTLKTSGDFKEPLPAEVHVALYRIAQETLNNIAKHSHATHVSISLQEQAKSITLTVSDNGRGFDRNQHSPGLGLNTMRERAEQIGALIEITSVSGKGTEIQVVWTDVHEVSKVS